MEIALHEFKNICMEMAELGAANYAKRIGAADDLISQRQAYREFSQSLVDDWTRRGMTSPIRSGRAKNSKLLYSRAELLACHTAEKINNHIQLSKISIKH